MITVQVDTREVTDALARLQAALANMQPAFDTVGSSLTDNIKGGFQDSQTPWGDRWQPLAPQTVARRRRGSDKPLLDTGVLRNSITYVASREGVSVGPSDNEGKSLTHQFGSPSRGVPARPFLPIRGSVADLPASWQSEIIQMIEAHITASLT